MNNQDSHCRCGTDGEHVTFVHLRIPVVLMAKLLIPLAPRWWHQHGHHFIPSARIIGGRAISSDVHEIRCESGQDQHEEYW